MKRIVFGLRLILRWSRVVLGRSYFHKPQGLGNAFEPGELAGYFNDLTAKTQWTGEIDNEGIPVNILVNGRKIYFATTIVQKALGHWDCWLLGEDDSHKEEFLRLCRWLLVQQDKNGGWPVWSTLGLSTASPYSAMTQGECISAFVRAWKLTGDSEFVKGARKALELLCRPIEDGGPAIYDGENLFLEETPEIPRSSILNGWIFTLFGLYDFWLAFGDKDVWDVFIRSLSTLKRHLSVYDCGYWSCYDWRGHLASPFYHNLHISQLTALFMIDEDPVIAKQRDQWVEYRNRWSNRTKAFIIKALQKLREPGEAVICK